jgi:hypothetical protein
MKSRYEEKIHQREEVEREETETVLFSAVWCSSSAVAVITSPCSVSHSFYYMFCEHEQHEHTRRKVPCEESES